MDLLLQHIHQETGIAQFIETTASKYNLPEETLHKFTDAVISSLLGAVAINPYNLYQKRISNLQKERI